MTAKSTVDVHLVLRKDGRLLFQLRQKTGYADGLYHLPAGHLEDGESADEAAAREAAEELGISVDPKRLRLLFTLHQHSRGSRVGLFFEAIEWAKEPSVMEPEKCAELRWFAEDDLPGNLVPYARYALALMVSGTCFGVFGWDRG